MELPELSVIGACVDGGPADFGMGGAKLDGVIMAGDTEVKLADDGVTADIGMFGEGCDAISARGRAFSGRCRLNDLPLSLCASSTDD